MNQQDPFQPGGPNFTPPAQPGGKGKAIAALVLGIGALVIPVPFLDVVMGVVGLVLAISARKEGAGGMGIAGLVLSIIGTVAAFFYTASFLLVLCAVPFLL